MVRESNPLQDVDRLHTASHEKLRAAVLDRLVPYVLPIAAVAVTCAVTSELSEKRIGVSVLYIAFFVVGSIAALSRGISLRIRAGVFLGIFYLLAVSELWMFGVAGMAGMAFLSLVTLVGVFYSFRAGLAILTVTAATYAAFAYIYMTGMIPIVHSQQAISQDLFNWITMPGTYVFFAILLLSVVGLLVKELEQNNLASQSFVSQLQDEMSGRRRAEETALASATTLRHVIDLVPHSIYAKDGEGRFIFVNKRGAELMGTTPDEAVGKTQLELTLVEGEALERMEEDRSVIDRGTPIIGSVRPWTDRDGRLFIEEITKIPFTDPQTGGPAELGISLDVTEQKLSEEKLRRSAAHFRSLIENAWDVILIIDDEGEIHYASPAAERVTGYPEGSNVGVNLLELIHPDDRPLIRDAVAEGLHRRSHLLRMEVRVRHAAGHWLSVEAAGKSIVDQDGNLRIVVTYHDITERKKAEAEQARLESQLRHSQKMEAMGQLAGGVAHDFNNFLQVIQGNIELIQLDEPEDSMQSAKLNEMSKASSRAAGLVRQLLAFSRREAIEATELDLNKVVAGVVKMLERLIGEDVRLVVQQDETLHQVVADEGQVEQILMNLCINARDAMSQGGAITIATRNVLVDEAFCRRHASAKRGPHVSLCMTDSGAGISPEIQERIFEPFFTTKEVGRGTGLGLATVYGIVRRHNGFLTLDSEQGKGASFTVYFPAAGSGRSAEAANVDSKAESAAGTEVILLAEDDEQVRRLAMHILTGAGYSVIEAVDGVEAIEFFERNESRIRLAVLDVIMPRCSGKEVYDAIRKRSDLPILFTSGYGFEVLTSQALTETNAKLLKKPYKRDDLLSAVRQGIDERHSIGP